MTLKHKVLARLLMSPTLATMQQDAEWITQYTGFKLVKTEPSKYHTELVFESTQPDTVSHPDIKRYSNSLKQAFGKRLRDVSFIHEHGKVVLVLTLATMYLVNNELT